MQAFHFIGKLLHLFRLLLDLPAKFEVGAGEFFDLKL
jgi:hypothetical protein